MIKNLFLALCAASLVGTASAVEENPFLVYATDFDFVVTGTGTYTQLLDALKEAKVNYECAVRFGYKDGTPTKIIISEDDPEFTPAANTLEFANVVLEFQNLVTLHPNLEESYAGPAMMAGYMVDWFGEVTPGELTIRVLETAVEDWLSKQPALDAMASFSLLKDSAEIQPTEGAIVKFQLINEEGEVVVDKNQDYTYGNQTYTNVGIVWNEGDLMKNQIALHFVPGALTEDEEWGNGQFTVLALGENYIPVPEPATGTLSLLALAGLAARRRRK